MQDHFSQTCLLRRLGTLFLFFILMHQGHAQGFLRAKGELIVNEHDEAVILRGMGLGGWMLQEGYMFKLGNIGQQYRIREAIEDVTDTAYATHFYRTWIKQHTTKKDIDALAKWGFNSIRLPMHYRLYTLSVEEEPNEGENTWLEEGFALTDSLLTWCKANNLYLILDLHAAPGGQGNDLNISDRNEASPSLWDSEANQQKTVALWRKLAERYAQEPWIGGYDVLNETNWGFEDSEDRMGTAENKNAPLRKLMIDITKAIREVDQQHLVIIEGNAFGNNYRGVMPPWDDNLILSFHKYGNFTDKQSIQGFLDLRSEYNIPLWLGESGENSNTWFTNTIRLSEAHNIGWAWWQGKKIGINQPLQIVEPNNYAILLDYWSDKGPKPAKEKAKSILDEFLENVKFEKNVIRYDVIDAMFRQVGSDRAMPFKEHQLKKGYVMQAVDYDLGRNNVAYADADTASYHYTPGVNTQGNRGRTYRNDGVDIKEDENGPYIYHTEAGEWLQYSVEVKDAATYQVSVNYSGNGELGLEVNNQQVDFEQPVRFLPGTNTIRLLIKEGDLEIRSLTFE